MLSKSLPTFLAGTKYKLSPRNGQFRKSFLRACLFWTMGNFVICNLKEMRAISESASDPLSKTGTQKTFNAKCPTYEKKPEKHCRAQLGRWEVRDQQKIRALRCDKSNVSKLRNRQKNSLASLAIIYSLILFHGRRALKFLILVFVS